MNNRICRPRLDGKSTIGIIVGLLFLTPAVLAGNSRTDVADFAIDTNWADNTVSIINLRSGSEKSRIDVGAKPYDIKSDEHGRFVYASLSGADKISVIDLQANLEAYKIQVGESPRDMAMTKDFTRLVVANSGSNSISVVDLATKKELYSIPVGLVPYGVGLADGDRTAIISNWGEGTISFVDLVERKEMKRVAVGHLPYTVAVSEAHGVAFTAAFGDDKVVVLDLKTRAVLHELPVGKSPWGIAVNHDGTKLAVANFYSSSVSVITVTNAAVREGYSVQTYELRGKRPGDRVEPQATARKPTNGTLATTEEVGGVMRAKHVALTSDDIVVFTDLAGNTVNTFDLNSSTLMQSIPVGHAPYGIDFLPQGIKKVTSSE
jgi:YVTN family beta-propeller protein